MSLPPQQFGTYRIVAPLGAGGMGEVYLAEDVRLNRRVALKVLPGGVAEDEAARKRLLREARAAATLDHPNICTVYDVGEEQGRSFIAMQYVEGETLADRMARAPLPLHDAVAIAAQVGAALAEAHAHGIVHRDVKPQNVMLTANGKVKVLDFGLAKLDVSARGGETLTNLTGPAAIAGTVPYMSPEQLRGEPIDARSDAFSFGVLLYEMVAGIHPFAAPSAAETMSAILTREPASIEPTRAPAEVQRILRKLLEKDRDRRYQTMRDVVLDLERLAGAPVSSAPPRSRQMMVLGTAAAVVVVAAAVAVWYLSTQRRLGPVPAAEFVRLTDFPDSVAAPALSPDGKMVAFIRGGWFMTPGEIYVKALPDGDAIQITHDPRLKYGPAFSADGTRVTYTAVTDSPTSVKWETWSVPVTGGPQVRLLSNAAGLAWVDQSLVLYSSVDGAALHMSVMAATPERRDERRVYAPRHERGMAHLSYPSPDRQWILVVEMGGTGDWQRCRLVPFDGRNEGREVGPEGACIGAGWAPDGRTMYLSATAQGATHLWRQRFPDGTPEPITAGPTTQEVGVAVAPDGRSLVTAIGDRQSSLWLHVPSGDRVVPIEGVATDVYISKDGARVYCLLGKTADSPQTLTRIDLASGRADRLLADFPMVDFDVATDEQTIAFTTVRGHAREVWIASPDGQFPPRPIAAAGDQPHITEDGSLLFRELSDRQNYLARVGRDGSGRRRIMEAPIVDLQGASPDGRWATVTAAFGTVQSAPATHAVDTTTGATTRLCQDYCIVRWAPGGHHLYVLGNPNATVGRSTAIPLPAGAQLPGPLSVDAEAGDPVSAWAKRPGVVTIMEPSLTPTADPSAYLFYQSSRVSNLFRVPLR